MLALNQTMSGAQYLLQFKKNMIPLLGVMQCKKKGRGCCEGTFPDMAVFNVICDVVVFRLQLKNDGSDGRDS